LSSVISDARVFVALLISIGIIIAAGIALLYRKKQKSIRNAGALSRVPALDDQVRHEQEISPHPEAPSGAGSSNQGTEAPKFTTFQKRSGMGTDLLRALLIALSLAVASALALMLLPQQTVDKIGQYLESRRQTARPEKIAFLYLGDEIINSQFHIRGVVRNISASPIERLDAVVRFYAQDRSLMETTIVRMNRETIGPNEIAQFELVYPSDRLGFAGYSTEFKLRQGETVPYKDLRRLPVQSK
jgi:hypothetical protein